MTEMKQEIDSVQERGKRSLLRAMGSAMATALYEPKTVEVFLNADGKLWQEKLGEGMKCIGRIEVPQAENIIKLVAGYHGKEITYLKPTLEAEFPIDGSRFAGQVPPVVSAPTFAIRKKAIAIFTLEQYVGAGIMTQHQYEVLKKAVLDHRNILVIGGTGSGKTTLVNAVINQMVLSNPTERICIIEDTGEIQCAAQNYVQYHTSLEVTMTHLLKVILRMRPDRTRP